MFDIYRLLNLIKILGRYAKLVGTYLVIQSHSLVDDTYIPSDFARRRFLNTLLREVIVPNTHSSYIRASSRYRPSLSRSQVSQ